MESSWRFEVLPTAQAVAARGAEILLKIAETRPGGHVALSGGSTPRAMYAVLREERPGRAAALRELHYHFGDERSVPNDHADSNVRLAREGFLDQLAVPETHIHAPDGSFEPLGDEARRLTQALGGLPKSGGVPVFDLIFLGMGDDGHTASLFPGTAALDAETPGFVANDVPQLKTRRLTLTFPVINAAERIVIMVTGGGKAAALGEIVGRSPQEKLVYPIERVTGPNVLWLLDEAAAAELPKRENK